MTGTGSELSPAVEEAYRVFLARQAEADQVQAAWEDAQDRWDDGDSDDDGAEL